MAFLQKNKGAEVTPAAQFVKEIQAI